MNLQINSLLQDAINNFRRNNFSEAKILLFKILDIEPKNFDALNIIGVINGNENNHLEALNFFKKAQKIRPDYNLINYNLAKSFSEIGKDIEAIKYYEIAIKLDKNHLGSRLNIAKSLHQLKRHDEALIHCDQAIKLKPDFAEAYVSKGVILNSLKRYDEALICYDHALKLKPDHEYLFGMLMHAKMILCNWQDFKVNIKSLSLLINDNKRSTIPFAIIALIDSLSIQRKSSEIWTKDKHPFRPSLGPISKPRHRKKIKIGYYSPDFREHAVAHILTEVIESHDKNQFELFGFYFGSPDSSKMHKRIAAAFNQFINVELKSDKDIALTSREIGIDIAVDLAGFTNLSRTDIFSYRAAPIQVNYLGYPGTMAAEYIDYIIADRTLIPVESQKHYSEKIVYLPKSYLINSSKREISKKIFTKEEFNLPKERFVFCCFNSSYKITPDTFDGWMRILKAVKDSVLWLLQDNHTTILNLLKEAQVRGIDSNRLIFAKKITPFSEHLARHQLADLFLDTLPYNAHTTASDALWAGLPVLTCIGESFASRVAASLLNAIELPELIARTQEEYEAKAIELGNNPEKLRTIKSKLEGNKLNTTLFKTKQFTRYIEAAYRQMQEHYQADLPPSNIYIEY
jgi:predicted O-linked N-acetylglucosamine transferase (SPINDLY family)